jgi:hypothetical protein
MPKKRYNNYDTPTIIGYIIIGLLFIYIIKSVIDTLKHI